MLIILFFFTILWNEFPGMTDAKSGIHSLDKIDGNVAIESQ
jgi:hypothetical protein